VGKGKRADVYLEVRKRRGHIFFECNKCLCLAHPKYEEPQLAWNTSNSTNDNSPHIYLTQ
jgi:hypothetical protein